MLNFKKNIFKGLYIITPSWDDTKKLIFITKKIIKNGCSILQYRNKISKKNIKKKQAFSLLKICRKNNIPLIINDNIKLCIKINADGLHIGYTNLSIFEVRYILGNKKIIGFSCYNSFFLTIKNFLNNVNYISLGGFYFTLVKKYLFKTNVKLINLIKKKINLFIIIIGGINKNNFFYLFKKNINMIAIISSIYNSKNIFYDMLNINNKLKLFLFKK